VNAREDRAGSRLNGIGMLPDSRLFPDEWLLQFDDSYQRIHAVAKRYLAEVKEHGAALKSAHHIEAAMLGKHFIEHEGLPLMAGFPNFKVGGLPPQAREYIVTMHEWLRDFAAFHLERDASERAEALDEHFTALFDGSLGYELTEPQLIELRKLVNELQEKISGPNALAEHRRDRLLKRLEKLQLELQSKLSSLDRLYGTSMEVLVVAQNLREKAPPVLELAGKIFALVWAIHSRKDGPGLSQTIVPLPLPPNGQFEIPLPIPLPFAVTAGRGRESRG
jgi:hypothetical protein